jgi:GNAT superfamily N-acetyltransferase
MRDPEIRPLTPDALGDALILSSTAGWNQRLDDWRVLLTLAPQGCYAAWHEGRVIGTAIGIDYGGFGWIAMMLVDPAWRSRGIGRRLLDAAMGAIPSDRPIRLDATPLGRPLYLSVGFEDDASLTRLVRPAEAAHNRPRASPLAPRPLRLADLASVASSDVHVFHGNRRPVLEWALDTAPEYAWIAGGDPPEYCVGRKGRLFDQVGPVVTRSDETATALVEAALAGAAGRAVTVDAVNAHPAFCVWLRTCGFEEQRPLFRMRRAPERRPAATFGPHDTDLAERAILGPEFA